jgi:hypothetical protein
MPSDRRAKAPALQARHDPDLVLERILGMADVTVSIEV